MIDMHIHSVYSDGILDLDELIGLSDRMERISVTDHNSVRFYIELLERLLTNPKMRGTVDRFAVGTEVTMEGYPDCLLYFPYTINLNRLVDIENTLTAIREKEAAAVRAAYEYLGFNNWEIDIARVNAAKAVLIEARTKELAEICYLKRTGSDACGYFEMEDLWTARRARRSISAVDYVQADTPFDIARRTGGIIVLAHPIRTSIKNTGRSGVLKKIESELDRLFSVFAEMGGTIIEWEFLDGEIDSASNRYPVLSGSYPRIRKMVRDAIDKYGFKCVWGSDTHKKYPEYYEHWEESVRSDFLQYIPAILL